jgi:hypothetical protein
LEYNTDGQSVLDGSSQPGNWRYAVGAAQEWEGGIPGPVGDVGETKVELYVRYNPADVPAEQETYHLVFRQTVPTFLERAQWRQWNTCDAEGDNFSILSQLGENMRMPDGKFHFKMVWPVVTALESANEWKQTSNPMTQDGSGVVGYEPINVPNDGGWFQGLENNVHHDQCLLDGSVDRDNWWFAIGSDKLYSAGIPGPVKGDHWEITTKVELYVKALPSVMPSFAAPAPGWRLIFR